MSKVALSGNASGTGTFTIASPNSNSDVTLSLPTASGTLNTSGSPNEVPAGSASAPAIYPTGDTNTGIFFPAADTIAFTEGGTESMRIDSSGNVGVGTSSPTARVHVSAPDGTAPMTLNTAGGSDSTRALNFNVAGDNYGKILVPSASGGAMAFWTGSANAAAERARIDTSGNLGIGTSSPGGRVHAVSAPGTVQVRWSDATNGTANLDTASGVSRVWSNVALAFGTGAESFTERMRLDTSGNLLVNKTNGSARFASRASDGSSYAGEFSIPVSGSGLFINFVINDPSARSQVGSVSTNGTSTTYATSSDYRLKNTIAPVTGALAKVAALKPCTYKWNADGSDGQGFIAHELAEVVPDAVVGEKDAVDAEGNPQYQGIDTSFLVATLTAAIQELKAIVDAQGAEIAALKGQA